MGTVRTLLSPVQKGGIWRVQIVWPNGTVRYFGKFPSHQDATSWIVAYPRLTMPVTEQTISEPPIGSRPSATGS
jgi:hypothetical protein